MISLIILIIIIIRILIKKQNMNKKLSCLRPFTPLNTGSHAYAPSANNKIIMFI